LQINKDHLLLMAVDLFFEYWLVMFLFPHKYAILFLFLKNPISVFLIVDVSFSIVPFLFVYVYFFHSNIINFYFCLHIHCILFLLSEDFFLQLNINNSYF